MGKRKSSSLGLTTALGLAAGAISATPAGAATVAGRQTAYDTATVNVGNSTSNAQTLNVEAVTPATASSDPDYLPNVVSSEDGGAASLGSGSLQALEAQAIAARSFLYYRLNTGNGTIGDGTNDQVYSGYGYLHPSAEVIAAVQQTDRIILRYGSGTGDTTIAGFFVAGAVPTANSGLPFGEASGSGTGGTQPDVTYNRGLTGNNITQTPLGYVTNPPSGNILNRGALSQNGANYLATNGTNNFDTADILRYFYGADVQLEVAAPPSPTDLQGPLTVENFNTDQGYFGNGVLSSRNLNVGMVSRTESTDSHSPTVIAGQPVGSQQIAVTPATTGTPFSFYDVSGLGPNSTTLADGKTASTAALALVGTSSTNLSMPSYGAIEYWVKVTSGSGLTTDILLNNDAGTVQTSLSEPLVADGQWHEYEFFVNQAAEFVSNFDTGSNASYFSVNSIGLTGVGAATVELDDVTYDQSATIAAPEPTTLAELGLATAAGAFGRRRRGRRSRSV